MAEPALLGLCGSLRAASFNRRLMALAARSFGGDFTEADLRLPLYDRDLEDRGMPDSVLRLADQVRAADAVVIACPEYNKAPPGVLKNALDWISRVPGHPFEDKPVAIISAAGGRAGGERTQYVLRWMLVPFRARVLTHPEVLVAQTESAFDQAGELVSPRYSAALDGLMARLRAEAGAGASGDA